MPIMKEKNEVDSMPTLIECAGVIIPLCIIIHKINPIGNSTQPIFLKFLGSSSLFFIMIGFAYEYQM